MTPIRRGDCPSYLIPYLADIPAEQWQSDEAISKNGDGRKRDLSKLLGSKFQILRDDLNTAFFGKCCYCESTLGIAGEGQIELFRPKGGVQELDGKYSAGLYWYLAADWRNLYLACPVCNRNKAARFPVMGDRAWPGMSYHDVVELEQQLLLDPCRDDPDEHLAFLENGTVAGRTDQGRATVELLVLNRQALVTARAEQVSRFLETSPSERTRRASEASPYAAVWRQMLAAQRDPGRASQQNIVAADLQRSLGLSRTQLSTEHGEGLDNYRAVARYVERVRIENFGPIQALDIDMSAPDSPQSPCFALLGENGVGKSTVLRAIAMALSGEDYLRSLRLSSSHFLPPKIYEGEVRVSISGQPDIVMTLRRKKPIQLSNSESSSLILAYGATRLLPRGRHRPKKGRKHAKIDNLFDPFLPLTDPGSWLAGLDQSRLADVNEVLASLLPEDQQLQLRKDEGGLSVQVAIGGDPGRKISELSDGYQSMLGMAVDIMEVMYPVYESMKAAQGIVLIDELGNHFHPAWRLRCVSSLRSAFPQIQFIYSTHEPLCLRGLHEGEVAVLMRDRLRRIYALEDLPPVERLRVDQLLSSEHFGLRSTVDPVMEQRIKEYEDLIGKGARSDEEERSLQLAIEWLTDAKYLGSTRRERLALQLIDNESSAPTPTLASVKAQSLSDSTVAKLKLLMGGMEPGQGNINDRD